MGFKERMAGIADEAIGLAKRAAGELAARPDLVIEGEKQQAAGARGRASSAEGGQVLGWKLDRDQRAALIALFPPRHAFVVADHVTLRTDAGSDAPLPPPCEARIVGHVDDGKGVEAMVVAIDGCTERPGGGTYHITWSLGPANRAQESNDAIARLGWRRLADPVPIVLHPARF